MQAVQDDSGSDDDELTMEIHDLRSKRLLGEREFQCMFDAKETEKEENEKNILHLRKENQKLREAYYECIRGDQKVIMDVFRKRGKNEILQMQNSSIGPAICDLDDKLSKQIQFLDNIKHVQNRQIDKLTSLTDEVNDLKTMADTRYESQLQQIINIRNNEIDKAKVKADTANKISRCYKNIRDILQKEVNHYPARITQIEKRIRKERIDREEANEANQQAQVVQERTLMGLSELEKESFNERRTRDLMLQKTRKEVEDRFRGFDLGDKKIVFRRPKEKLSAPTPFGLNLYEKREASNERIDKQPARQLQILNLREDFDKMKDSIMVSDVNEVVKRFDEQNNTQKHLRWQKKTLSKTLADLKKDLNEVESDLTELKYSCDAQDTAARNELEQMADFSADLDIRLGQAKTNYEGAEKLMNKVQIAVRTLFDKLADIKLKPPHHNYSTGDPIEDIQNCQQKLESVISEISAIDDPRVLYCCLSPDRRTRFMQFVDSRLPLENLRFRPTSEEHIRNEFCEEPDDRADYLSNDDIKARSLKLIEQKTMRKRKKGNV